MVIASMYYVTPVPPPERWRVAPTVESSLRQPSTEPPVMRRFFARCALPLVLVVLAACSGGDTPVVTEPPPAAQPLPPGMLSITVEGLPDGVPADITVSGPGFTRTAAASIGWSDLPGGNYTITVRPARALTGTYSANPSTLSVTVVSGAPPTIAAVRYEPLPSALALTIFGVPGGVAAPVTVTTPADSAVSVGESRVLTHPVGGRWRFTADTLLYGGFRFAPSPVAAESSALFGDTARLSVSYAVSSGAIAVAVAGLPSGLDANVSVRGPNGFLRSLASTQTLTDLSPGVYRVVAAALTRSGITYRPQPDSADVTVAASLVASPAGVIYAAQVGRLVVTTSGLPDGTTPTLTLVGANGVQALSGATSLDSLPVGQYQVTAVSLTAGGVKYAPAAGSQSAAITTGVTTSVNVAFSVLPTVVEVPVSGLPDGVNASITLTPPSGAPIPITSTLRVSPALAGTWRVTSANVTSGGATYVPSPASTEATVVAGDTLRLPVQYTITTGSLVVTVSGVPNGSNGSVTVTGPNGFSQAIPATTTLSLLAPGSYTISANPLSNAGVTYLPDPSVQQRTVVASLQPATASVTYGLATGSITIAVAGLPGGITPTFSLSGTTATVPLSGAQTVSGLNLGAYSIGAATLTNAGIMYTPSPSSANVSVTANNNTLVTFTYAASGGTNYSIANVHVTQATQRLDGSVALVAGRDALLRVFVQATVANTAQPAVRVRVYDGATLLRNVTIAAPAANVRTSVAQGTLQSSWNLLVPAANMRPGLRVLAELDPAGAYPDANAADNVWPAGGSPQSITTHNVPPFTVRFVPVITGALTGNVSNGNYEQFLVTTRRLFPISQVVADVRAPFTSSATVLQSNDANGAWLTVLSEMNALRTAEAAPGQHYYGVVATSYGSGIAGYGYVPGRAAIGWDKLPSGDNVAAHEWGHNFSRSHAPCGVTGDPNYPYAGGVIGQIGWNGTTNTLVQANATDVMSYCGNNWISDYNWSAVLQYRGVLPNVVAGNIAAGATSAAMEPQDGLLVWGRVVDGRIELEPAFRVRAPVSAASTGTHRVELLDTDGAALQTVSFSAERVDHVTARDERHFAVVVPWTTQLDARLATLRVRDSRSTRQSVVQSAAARATGQSVTDPEANVMAIGGSAARITWNSSAYPMAMVRDALNGQILGFVRRSGGTVVTNGRPVEVVLSDGVRSVVRR